MANKRWAVDAHELLVEIERIYDDHYFRSNYQCVHDIFNSFRRLIRRYAKFQAVEVVRCKDCKYRADVTDKGNYLSTEKCLVLLDRTISAHSEKGKTMDERDVHIIIALADNRMNMAEAARVLYMHRNTVVYHIQKIRQNTGLDPLNFYDLYELVKMARKAEV